GAGVVGGLAVAGAGSAAAQGVGPEKLIQTSRQARQAVVRAKGQPMGSYPFLVRCLSAGARDLSGYRPGRQFTLNESAGFSRFRRVPHSILQWELAGARTEGSAFPLPRRPCHAKMGVRCARPRGPLEISP